MSTTPHQPSRFPKRDNNNPCYFKRQKKHMYLRKCSYVLAVMSINKFMEYGGVKLFDGIYIIPKDYSETGNGGCAIIGIHKQYINQLLNYNTPIYYVLSKCKELEGINGIDRLSPYRLDVLKFLQKYMYFVHNNELILFIIEPKGDMKYEKIYPSANLCLCGGGLEPSDNECFEKCAKREFLEETGIKLPDFNNGSVLITKQKFTFQDRVSMHFIIRIS